MENHTIEGIASRRFCIFLLLLLIPGIQCLNRQWDNPIDPEYQSTWVKFATPPSNLGMMGEINIFSINNELYLTSLGVGNYFYKYEGGVTGWVTITGNPSVNYRFDAVAFHDRLYFLTGAMGQIKFGVYYFDPVSDTFSPEVKIAQTNGSLHTIASSGNRLLVFESDTADGGKTSIHELNPATGSLTYISSCPHIRTDFACAGISNEIYLIGGLLSSSPGSQGEQTGMVETYNFSTHSWSQKADIPVKSNVLSSTCDEGGPYVYDGNTGSMLKFLPAQNTWQQKTGYQLYNKGAQPSLTRQEGIIFAWIGIRRSGAAPGTSFEIYIYHYKND